MGGLRRFFAYQQERFPVLVLLCTTFAVVVSSFAIALGPGESMLDHRGAIAIGTLTGLLFLFHMRVLDDHKDCAFDAKHHKTRPVQRGDITLRELAALNYIGVMLQAALNVFLAPLAFIWWLVAFGYSLLAGREFFLGEWLRQRFFTYNALNLMQLLFMQAYLYALIGPMRWSDPLLIIHFIFVLMNAAILEFARKMKHPSEESTGKDTYSSRMGVGRTGAAYAAMLIITYGVFLSMLLRLPQSPALLIASAVALCIAIASALLYISWDDRRSSRVVEACAVVFYLSLHLLLAATRVV